MADFIDGTYEIISVLGPTVAIDVKGASDNSGANVQVYTRNDSDAQKWSTFDDGTNGIQIACALSGRCLDVAGGKITSGTNVWQWENNDSRAQRWDIVPDGKTVIIGGTSYSTYVVKSHGTDFALDVSGGNVKPGTNVQIYAANGTDAQRWAFVPINILSAGGTYKIVSGVKENMVLDVSGASTANGANVMLHPSNGGSNQRWIAQKNDDGTLTFLGAGAKKALDDKGAGTKAGTNVQIWAPNYGTAQSWLAVRMGEMMIAGQTFPTYRLTVQAGMNLCLDVQGGSNKPGTNVRLWTANTSAAQRFAFVPASVFEPGLPTPAALSIGTNIGNNQTTVAMAFSCDWRNFQVRCRFRSRGAGGAFGSWSDYKSALDGQSGNEGWGDAWAPNFTFDNTTGDSKTVSIPIPDAYQVDGTIVMATEMQVEVRAHGSNWQGVTGYTVHGNAASKTFGLYWRPTAQVTAATLTGTGLLIRYTSDLEEGGCTVTVSAFGVSAMAKGLYGASGSVLIPAKQLKAIPSGTIPVTAWVARDLISNTTSASLAVADASNRTTLSITAEASDAGTYLLTIPTVSVSDTVQSFLIAQDTPVDTHEKSRDERNVIIEAISPLRTPVKALIWIFRTDGSWDAQTISLAPINNHAFCWTFDGGSCVLDLGHNENPTQEDTISRAAEDYEVISRPYHAYRLHKARERQLDVSGAVVTDMNKHGAWSDFDALLEAGHATFRNPRGEILPVVVTAISRPLEHPGWTEIKITQRQETR
ncbi:ricin-type beta-trefoil lectin domain protein [Pseudoramibacter alactolyticus ATCC 23263]|uniref:Ricin-type beta-trefoil lectin domain protein n=1 Tax=Pseudoramibacter alactolyticus ATCC 23263 TaxID=887929 RepID=E6MGX3_9FIRM|nr:RICIN domain-containing protein [Pseudoramibacter alactolyticus]EFV01863.1 ricin-type beta-trefoil lectin domain protein [Pseudoramibacter alactolyticus ATCC 23263]